MNFVFIVDTSISMTQIFDNKLSFLDSAKCAIEIFYRSNNKLLYNHIILILDRTAYQNKDKDL